MKQVEIGNVVLKRSRRLRTLKIGQGKRSKMSREGCRVNLKTNSTKKISIVKSTTNKLRNSVNSIKKRLNSDKR